MRAHQLLTIIFVHNFHRIEGKHLYKRSPLDVRPTFNHYPQINHLTQNHIFVNQKKSDLVLIHHHNYPLATSNVQHSSLHTDIRHIIKDNVKYPIVTQTLTHTSTNITHPSKSNQFLLSFLPQNHVFLHDLSVIPLRKAEPKVERDSSYDEYGAKFRKFYGGFGEGLTFGGHGAGHGFFAYG